MQPRQKILHGCPLSFRFLYFSPYVGINSDPKLQGVAPENSSWHAGLQQHKAFGLTDACLLLTVLAYMHTRHAQKGSGATQLRQPIPPAITWPESWPRAWPAAPPLPTALPPPALPPPAGLPRSGEMCDGRLAQTIKQSKQRDHPPRPIAYKYACKRPPAVHVLGTPAAQPPSNTRSTSL
eukprot:1144409-Pelagomonas_calceolata.AAC.13